MCTNHIFCIFSRIHTHVIFHVFERFRSNFFHTFWPDLNGLVRHEDHHEDEDVDGRWEREP